MRFEFERKRIMQSFILLFLLSVPLLAHSNQILGKVVSSNSTSPLEKVYVYSYPFDGTSSVSDDKGFFSIFLFSTNEIDTLAFYKIGYNLLKVSLKGFEFRDTIRIELTETIDITKQDYSEIIDIAPKSNLLNALEKTRSLLPDKHHQLKVFLRELDSNKSKTLALVEAVGLIDDQSYSKSLSGLKITLKSLRKSDSFDRSKYLPTKRYIPDVASSNLFYRTYENNFFRLAYVYGTVLNSIDEFLNKKELFIAGIRKSNSNLFISFNFLFTNGSWFESGTIEVSISDGVVTSLERILRIDDDLMQSSKVNLVMNNQGIFPSYIKLYESKVGQINDSLENSTYSLTELYVIQVITKEFEKINEKSVLSRISVLSDGFQPYDKNEWEEFETKFPIESEIKKDLEKITPLQQQFLANSLK